MIITCNNCEKNFTIDSSLIPEKGRLLQCNSCSHKWFFKKKISTKSTELIKVKNLENSKSIDKQKNHNLEGELSDIKHKIIIKNEKPLEKNDKIIIKKEKKIKNKNIIPKLILVFIISFIALIILIDTFTITFSKVFPNIEFLLYNFYETIRDFFLFFKDLI